MNEGTQAHMVGIDINDQKGSAADLVARLKDEPVLIAGAGVSGAGCARLLVTIGVDVTVADDNEIARLKVHEATGAKESTIADAMDHLDRFGLVVTSPGWRPDSPLLVAAAAAGLRVIGDVELSWQLDKAGVFGPPRTWVAITGTNGKTTTTAMCAAMLNRPDSRALAVGNIGIAIQDALMASPRIDVMVCELSSFQLHWCDSFVPDVGCLINIAEDHLDWHGSLSAYAHAKSRVLLAPTVVVPTADELVDHELKLRSAGTHPAVLRFGLDRPVATQANAALGIVDGSIAYAAEPGGKVVQICSAESISPPGPAGKLDALAAAAIACGLKCAPAQIARGLANFEVAGHRGQVVFESSDTPAVTWVDNSKATNPHAAAAAMAGYDSFVWLAGGQLKGAHIDDLVSSYSDRMRGVVVLGCDRAIIARAVHTTNADIPVVVVDDTDPLEAMSKAVDACRRLARPGDAVLLAPAAASLDMYKGMGQRGDIFARLAASTTQTSG